MINGLKENYSHLFEEALLNEIIQVGTFKEVAAGEILIEIAYELHTSRVVISRLLKNLEKMGRIELHRNSVKILS